jgi:hypothetical protein
MQETIESETVTRTRCGGSGGQGLIKDRRNAVACYRMYTWHPSERGMVFHDHRSFLFFEASSELPFCMGQPRGREPRKGKGGSVCTPYDPDYHLPHGKGLAICDGAHKDKEGN